MSQLDPSGQSQGPPSAATARALLSRLMESYRSALAQQRPWSEFTDRTTFSKPDNLNDATSRIRKNLGYFRANYLTILLAIVVLTMLINPVAIFWLALLSVAWIYLFMIRAEPIVIAGRSLNDREKFLAMSAISILIVFGLTSVGSVLISGVIIASAIISVHAALRIPDDLFLDEAEQGGLFSFLGNSSGSGLPTSIGRV